MNYIKHLNSILWEFNEDMRLRPQHVSLYMGLFCLWNKSRFVSPIFLNRNELMGMAKIGSVNTYHKTLKELHCWKYIIYEPSHSSMVGSKVTCITFDTGADISTDTTSNIGSDTSANTSADNTSEQQVRLYNKTIVNNNKPIKQIYPSDDSRNSLIEKKEAKQVPQKRIFVIPKEKEVRIFFEVNRSTALEAQKFVNYFTSTGWLIGGKAKMRDWQAAARNWILNSSQTKISNNPLSATKNKNYGEPL